MPDINYSDERVLMAFVYDTIRRKGVEGLSQDDQQLLAVALRQRLDQAIEHAMIEALSDEKLKELNELLDRDCADDEIESFFDESGADFGTASKQALAQFQKDYLEKGNNAEILEQARAERAEFLATAPQEQEGVLVERPEVPEPKMPEPKMPEPTMPMRETNGAGAVVAGDAAGVAGAVGATDAAGVAGVAGMAGAVGATDAVGDVTGATLENMTMTSTNIQNQNTAVAATEETK